MALKTDYNFKNPDISDNLYSQLIKAHQNLTDEESIAYNARLVLLLMNHVSDEKTIAEAFEAAKL